MKDFGKLYRAYITYGIKPTHPPLRDSRFPALTKRDWRYAPPAPSVIAFYYGLRLQYDVEAVEPETEMSRFGVMWWPVL